VFRNCRKILIGIAAILFAARALAADLDVPAPPAPYPNWSGAYLGLAINARYDAVDANVTSATVGTPPVPIALPNIGQTIAPGAMAYLDNIAIGARIYGGWNWQVAPAYVVGVEGDFNYANETSFFTGSPYPANLIFGAPATPFGASSTDQFKVKTTWDASARVRAGWLANPSTLLYLTVGVAAAHIEALSACSNDPPPNPTNCGPGNYFGGTLGRRFITHAATGLGWTAGVGMEMSFWTQWVARVQYRYSDFGYWGAHTFSFTDTRICSGCPSAASSPLTVSYQLPMAQHNFEVGLAYRFGP
jgi:outer membrane immunogenic protein